MNFLERYLGDTYELVDTLKSSEQGFVAVVYDKRAKRLCVMKQRALHLLPIYQILKELVNPHVPQIYRSFERDGKLIVVEEHIDGQTLEELLIYQPHEINEVLAENILLQLCECLAAFHAKNIIHRDLKPANIMLTEKNLVKLIDFGIARIFKPSSTADTELMGTRGYAPPEQFGLFDFGQTDKRSDIYALGMTIKTLLGENYDGRLKKFLDKCTALEPSQRFQSVEELRRAILSSKRSFKFWKVFVAALIGLATIFFPRTTNFNFQPEEIPAPVEEIIPKEKISAPVEVQPEEKLFELPTLPQNSLPELNLPTPAPLTEINHPPIQQEEKLFELPTLPQNSLPELDLPTLTPPPEINRPPVQQEEKSSGEVELNLFLNGEPTAKEHMVYLYDWQSWSRDKYGQIIFPADWQARLHVENHSGKDLIKPSIEVNIGDYEKKFDMPAIRNGQSIDLEIPLGNKLASPEKGSGHLQIILQAEGVPQIFLNKTFFLVK